VFLLTEAQCRQYFADDGAMVAQYNGENVSWWTLTPGNDLSGRVCTYGDGGGGLYMTGNQVTTADGCGVRPAIWIDIAPEGKNSGANSEQTGNGAALIDAGVTKMLENDAEDYMFAGSTNGYDVAIAVSTETGNYTITISKKA
jgi:hypothetical protein